MSITEKQHISKVHEHYIQYIQANLQTHTHTHVLLAKRKLPILLYVSRGYREFVKRGGVACPVNFLKDAVELPVRWFFYVQGSVMHLLS